MARDEGFVIADVATNYFDDEKVRRLWRILGDPGAMCEATSIHQSTVLASWRDGKRLTVEEAAPLWLVLRPEIVSALMRVGLLDRTKRVPIRSWTAWFEPAQTRRDARREGGRNGGLAKAGKPTSSPAKALLKGGSTRPADRPAVRPSVLPSDPSSAPRRATRGRAASNGGKPESMKDALARHGFDGTKQGAGS